MILSNDTNIPHEYSHKQPLSYLIAICLPEEFICIYFRRTTLFLICIQKKGYHAMPQSTSYGLLYIVWCSMMYELGAIVMDHFVI